ncbi:uncharacterized protein LAESUDRAFT_741340 [Laetiporus sulphureus 93-53]|uniref:Csf1 N-terminal domain-containing protein n=1 Tax=Laetiporus sulphureus 93-53 TaxID=1314785 RepID=A0A165GZH4_9APHY|nr:uncharacterized protein LAESUDRAFT_741340 [Laetiporus sulphureus 93-53]KZT11041.1 hypothetical protein LAESUDRAFT_741340 [Laetiporus sulphureus 93-53]
MLNVVLLVVAICVVVALILYLFFWNRLVALILSLIVRLALWNQDESSVWISIGSIHFSVLMGRIAFKDLRYHSSNQTIRVVKGQISWRYWIRQPVEEEDLSHARVVGEDANHKEHVPLSCRIHVSLQGLEWYIYNRTAAYDNIVARKEGSMPSTPAPTPTAAGNAIDAREALRKLLSRTSVRHNSTSLRPSLSVVSPMYRKSPGFVKYAINWIKTQLPNFDPKNLLPIGIEATKGAIICGNASIPSLLVIEFGKADCTYGIVQPRSKFDLYKQLLNVKLRNASACYVENMDYQEHMNDVGEKVHDQIKKSHNPYLRQYSYLSYLAFEKLWDRLKLWSVALTSRSRLRAFFGYTNVPVPHPPTWGWRKNHKDLEDETPLGIDFSTFEYAIERKILEAPEVEVLYYVDVVGIVPFEPPHPQADFGGADPFDIGNGDLPPEWGIDIMVRGGFLRYGPWADRQRVILQHCFFPPPFHDVEPTAHLKPGDARMWTGLKIFVELQDGTTLHIPFREASKDWQWGGKVDVPNRPRKREAASIHLKAGDSSTITYIMPMVAGLHGYQPILEVHLDTVAVTSSLNDMRLLTAESCRVRCQMPSPLKWNGEREWTFAISLRQTQLFLLRDHINMFTDLGKDWSTGPPTPYYRFTPMIYAVELDLHHYEINTYVNDHNIIDKPLIKEDNALVTLRGTHLVNAIRIPLSQYRPEATTVSFWIEVPDVAVALTLPRWNTNSIYPTPDRSDVGRVGVLTINGSYRYHAEVSDENIDQLKLDIRARDVVYKAFGWTIRHFMILRDNYFGIFTHFSTLSEYLEKRRKGQPVGDPIDLQYRPGKSNSMEVELGVMVDRGLIALPAGLPGYEVHSAGQDRIADSGHLGTCLLVKVPEVQLQLRTNDYYMDMSLNANNLFGRFEECCSYASFYRCLNASPSDDIIILDGEALSGLDITANRLFGPKPHTSTYVCMWEVHMGNIKGVLSTYQTALLSAVGSSFGLNFSDPLNAPAKEFEVPVDPDVTFLKLRLDSINVVWLAPGAAIELFIPDGLRLDSNDLAGKSYRKVISVRLPIATCKILVTSRMSRKWYEASRLDIDANVDIYSAPTGWQDRARAQTEYVAAQDKLTSRASCFYSARQTPAQYDELLPGRGLLDSDLYLPQLRIPKRFRRQRTAATAFNLTSPIRSSLRPAVPIGLQSESEGDEWSTEADRDARVVNARPSGTSWAKAPSDEEDMTSSDESDEGDSSDHRGWDSEESETSGSASQDRVRSAVSRYKDLTTHYEASHLSRPYIWDTSPFVVIRNVLPRDQCKSRPNLHNDMHNVSRPIRSAQLHAHNESAAASTVIRVHSKREIVLWFNPLLVLAVEQFLADIRQKRLTPELRFDVILAKYIRSAAAESPEKATEITVLDLHLTSIHISSVQAVGFSAKRRGKLEDEQQMNISTIAALSLSDLHFLLKCFQPGGQEYSASTFDVSLQELSVKMWTEQQPFSTRRSSRIQNPSWDIMLNASRGTVGETVSIFLGDFIINVDHATPEAVLATSSIVLQTVMELDNAWKCHYAHFSVLDQQTILQVLRFARQRVVVDPLSTFQPSYLVQKGRPDQLRNSSCFKFLVYIRNCLRYLEASERGVVDNIETNPHSKITLFEIILSLESQDLSHSLDEDVLELKEERFMQELFHGSGTSPEIHIAQDSRRIKAVVLHWERILLTIHHTNQDLRTTFNMGPIVVAVRWHVTVFHPTSPNTGKTYANLLPRERTRFDCLQLTLSVDLGHISFTIMPQLVQFLQLTIRIAKSYSPALCMPRANGQVASKAPRIGTNGSNVNADVALSIESLTFKAAADKLVVIFSISNLQWASMILAKLPVKLLESQCSMSHFLTVDESILRLCSTDLSQPVQQSTLAFFMIEKGKMNVLFSQEHSTDPKIRAVCGSETVHLDVPRSALRLYCFLQEWRADYLPGMYSAFQDLLSELHEERQDASPHVANVNQQSLPDIHLHLSTTTVRVTLQVMLGVWLSWDIQRTLLYVTSSLDAHRKKNRTFGIQMGPHTVAVTTQDNHAKGRALYKARVELQLPRVSVTGNYGDEAIRLVSLVDFVQIMVEPSDLDTLISLGQKSGQDYNDFMHLVGETHQGNPADTSQLIEERRHMKLHASFRMKGFRVGVQGHSSVVLLECDNIGGGIDDVASLAWQVKLSDLALSLASLSSYRVSSDKGHRSAFVTIDFEADMKRGSSQSSNERLEVAIIKAHAVMQPTSIGELSDFIDELQAEVLAYQEDRANELAQFKEKTKGIMRSLDVKIGEQHRTEFSWLDRSTILLTIRNIGVAFPLAAITDLQMPRSGTSGDFSTVRAFLLSIKSLSFGTEHGDTGQAIMKGFCFQFVPRFRQSADADFSGDNHQTRNRLLYPEMTANIHSERSNGSRRVYVAADVSGFILDLDSMIPDYIFSLIDVYREGKDRMDRLKSNISRSAANMDLGIRGPRPSSEHARTSLPTANVLLSLTFASGRIRMHSTHSRHQSSMKRKTSSALEDSLVELPIELGVEIFDLPVVTVWGEYNATTPLKRLIATKQTVEPSILMFKATIHSSHNTLKPTLLPFITELVAHVETRLRQSSRGEFQPAPVRVQDALHSLPADNIAKEASDVVTGLKISLSLRIDQSKLELTCQPDVNVVAGLHWDSGGFVINISPNFRRVTFSGTVGGLTIGLKHGFLSEDCVRLDARNLAFNVTFAKTESAAKRTMSSISVVVDTQFSGGIRFSRLQDVLCFKAVWLDRIPVINGQNAAFAKNNSKSVETARTSSSSQELTVAVLLHFRSIELDADLGQSISSLKLTIHDMLVRTCLSDALSELTLSIAQLDILATGNVSGQAAVPDFRFQTIRESENSTGVLAGGRMLDLTLTTGVFYVELESEYQKLIQYRAEPIEVKIFDDWSKTHSDVPTEDRHVDLAFTVSGSEVTVVMNVGTIPKLFSYADKFKATLENQREGASRESRAFRLINAPKPDNPLSTVANAMIKTTRNRFKEEPEMTYAIGQRMSLRLAFLQLVVFPRSMRDPELARFIGRDVHARLDRLVESHALPARRDLHLSFSSITTSRISQLNHALLAKERMEGSRQWLKILVKDAPEATIFGLPSMDIRMQSDEFMQEQRRTLRYDFTSRFTTREGGKKDAEDIYITLNMALYAWLTSLRKAFAREMEQVQASETVRAVGNALVPQTSTPRKRGNESVSLRTDKEPEETIASLREVGRPRLHRHAMSSLITHGLDLEEPPALPSRTPTSPATSSRLSSPGSTNGASDVAAAAAAPASSKTLGLVYEPRSRHIERLTMRQLGEATPDVMHPFFMKKAGFSLEDSLPQYVHEYATMPTEEIMKALLNLYSKQLSSHQLTDSPS